jgi:ribosomal protein S25
MSFQSDTPILDALRGEVHPLGTRRIAKKTGVQKKVCRAILRDLSKKGVIQRVHPCVVGSCKTKLTLYKYTTA